MKIHSSNWNQKQFVDAASAPLDSSKDGWHKVVEKKPNKIYQINGRDYKVIDKMERKHISLGGIALGILCTVGSFGLAPILSKNVRQLLTGRQVLRVVEEVFPNVVENNNQLLDAKKTDVPPQPFVDKKEDALPKPTMEHVKPHSICKHDGNSCFINTTLQLLAHFTAYRNLFEPLHPLIQQSNETDEHFKNRQEVQQLGNELIKKILDGGKSKVSGVREFLKAIEKCQVMPSGMSAEAYLNQGGDIKDTLDWIVKIMKPDDPIDLIPTAFPTTLKELAISITDSDTEAVKKTKQQAIQMHNNQQKKLIDASCFKFISLSGLSGSNEQIAREIMVNGVKFVLEAVVIGGHGHTYPYIRSGNGNVFIKYDDMTNLPEEIEDLNKIKNWFSLYYIKK